MDDLFARLEQLEEAILAIANAEFGDKHGHPFRGNQWKKDGESDEPSKEVRKMLNMRKPLDYISKKFAKKIIKDAPYIFASGEEDG